MGRVSRALAKAHRPPLSGKRSDTRPTVGSNCLPSRALGLQVATGRIQQASLGCSTLCAWSSWARKRRQND